MKACEELRTDETLRELAVHGSVQFPFQHYRCRYDAENGNLYPWHWHSEAEAILMLSGETYCLVGNQRMRLRAGEGVFLQSGVIHSYETPDRCEMLTLVFLPTFVAPEGSALYTHFVQPLLDANITYALLTRTEPWHAEVLATLARLGDITQTGAPGAELDVHASLCALWATLYRHRELLAAQGLPESCAHLQTRLRTMIAFIEEQFDRKLTLREIAHSANVSDSEALRCFREGVCASPICYLNRHRLNFARARLLQTSLSVTEIAAEAGFSSAAYFDRMFARCFGESPTLYRRRRAG